jgi:hypothetical protein
VQLAQKKLQAFLKSSKKSCAISLLRRQATARQTCHKQQPILRGNWVVLGYRKLSLSIIDNFAIFLVIELSIISAKIIDNSLNSIFDKNTGLSTKNLKKVTIN